AQIHRHGISVARQDRRQSPIDLRERLVPARLREGAIALTDERRPDPVGILVELLQRRALRADEALAEDVVFVSPDRDDLIVRERYLEPACRLAERTGPVRGAKTFPVPVHHRESLRLGLLARGYVSRSPASKGNQCLWIAS